jgi:hypothetical protein
MNTHDSRDDDAATKKKASDDDPIGACQFTNAAGQLVCLDNMKKSECDQIQNSIFIEGGSCQ